MNAHSKIITTLLERAIGLAGSEAKLGALAGYSQNAIWHAKRNGRISAELADAIQKATGGMIRRQDLRPDVFGEDGEVVVTLGALIRRSRKALSLGQVDIADSLGVTVQAVSQWERDVSSPTGINLLRLASLLSLDLSDKPAALALSDEPQASGFPAPACGSTPSSVVSEAIEAHRISFLHDESIYDDDGKPLVSNKAVRLSAAREVQAFRHFAKVPCLTSADVQAKLAYFHTGLAAARQSPLNAMLGDEYASADDRPGTDTAGYELLIEFIHSLTIQERAR